MSVNREYQRLISILLANGERVNPRGQETLELINHRTVVDMLRPIVTLGERKLNYHFMLAEAYWILSGDNALAPLTKYVKRMADFSDDGRTLWGAYGIPFMAQREYAIQALIDDPWTRQSVMTFWRQNPIKTRDVPCTVSLQFLLRGGNLDLVVNMRSSDAFLGWPYDVFSFTMIAAYVAIAYRVRTHINCPLGLLHINAGSQHLYERDYDQAFRIDRAKISGELSAIDIHDIPSPDVLMAELARARDGAWNKKTTNFLRQLQPMLINLTKNHDKRTDLGGCPPLRATEQQPLPGSDTGQAPP